MDVCAGDECRPVGVAPLTETEWAIVGNIFLDRKALIKVESATIIRLGGSDPYGSPQLTITGRRTFRAKASLAVCIGDLADIEIRPSKQWLHVKERAPMTTDQPF